MKTTSSILLLLLASLAWCPQDSCGFVVLERPAAPYTTTQRRPVLSSSSSSSADDGGGPGVVGKIESSTSKSYDSEAVSPRKDVMDADAAMREFFQGAAEDWKPLFRSMTTTNDSNTEATAAATATAAAMQFLEDADISNFEFSTEETTRTQGGGGGRRRPPWQRLNGIPTEDGDRAVLANFLDQVQASLIGIPVDETTEDDENDLQFLEEGRRMLVCSRFHVISQQQQQEQQPQGEQQQQKETTADRIDQFESLFGVCWNEMFHLQDEDEANTGSLIVVPGSDLNDLRRFVDINLQRPLQWLGLDERFEVASLERGTPAIRIIHKLSEIPTDLPDEPETMGSANEEKDDNDEEEDAK